LLVDVDVRLLIIIVRSEEEEDEQLRLDNRLITYYLSIIRKRNSQQNKAIYFVFLMICSFHRKKITSGLIC
jgi:hypothetical protein